MEKKGWLRKRAVKSGRNWRKRFFVLRGSELSYFKDGAQKKKKGQLILDTGCSVSTDPSEKRENAFRVTWADGRHIIFNGMHELTLVRQRHLAPAR
jgi:hypothetical protein